MRRDKIYLVGFIAAGKTTLARALGRRLDWRAIDIDELIEARERATISDIFASRGEPYFRSIEREVLRALLPPRHVVIATGGGTFADADNRAEINRDGVSIWLDLPLERLIDRLPAEPRRPLAPDRAALEALYAVRRSAYQQAHLRIDASRPVEEQVERVVDLVGV